MRACWTFTSELGSYSEFFVHRRSWRFPGLNTCRLNAYFRLEG